MSIVTVFARIKAKPGQVEAVRAALLGLVEPTTGEQGCINYDLYQDRADESLFVFHENWDSETDLDQHLRSDHIQRTRAVLGDLVEFTEVLRTGRIS